MAKKYDGSTPLPKRFTAEHVRLRFDELMQNLPAHYEHGIWDKQVVAWFIAKEVQAAHAA